ncbi:c-type cytochrome [Alsobacter soli]|nr:cytochrome c [Alsobacter soli]
MTAVSPRRGPAPRGRFLPVAAALAAMALCWLGAPAAVQAQTARQGRAIVARDCTGCHALTGDRMGAGGRAPSFPAIARMSSTTELSVTVFLRTSHAPMPNIMLSPEEISAVAKYIVSLKRGG